MRRTPYTTRTGVQIGLMYQPPRRMETSQDMERLQRALLGRSGVPQGRWAPYLWLCACAATIALFGAIWG